MTDTYTDETPPLTERLQDAGQIITDLQAKVSSLEAVRVAAEKLRERISIELNSRHPLMVRSIQCAVFDYDDAVCAALTPTTKAGASDG